MYFLGTLFIVLGGWLVDSGIEDRHPIATLEQLIQAGPAKYHDVLTGTKGDLGSPSPLNLSLGSLFGDALMSGASATLEAGLKASGVPSIVSGAGAATKNLLHDLNPSNW